LQKDSELRRSKHQTQIPFRKENIYKKQEHSTNIMEVFYSNQGGGFPTWYPIGIKILTRNYDKYIRIHENSPIIYFSE